MLVGRRYAPVPKIILLKECKKMSINTNRIEEAQERAEQLKRQRRLLDNREKEQKRKIDVRRKIIIGAIIVKCFPCVTRLQPKLNQSDTNREFAELEEFFAAVAKDEKYAALLQEKLGQKLSFDIHEGDG